jgi:FkbM family methyltransferase
LALLRTVRLYRKVFPTLAEMLRFRRGLQLGGAAGDLEFHPRALGGAGVSCRAGSSDLRVLWDTFSREYHLPPPEAFGSIRSILDLGANIGTTAAHLAALFPAARVGAVEMDAGNAEMARRNTLPWADRVSVLQAAVWYEPGRLAYTGGDAWGFRIVAEGEGRGLAQAMTIDQIADHFGMGRIGFLKVDIEGAEAPILAKDPGFLCRVDSLNLEYHEGVDPDWCRGVLEGAGLTVRPHPGHPRALLAYRAGMS